MLAPGVERWRKHTAVLPFEGLLTAAFGPNTGRTAPLDNVDQLFEQVASGQRLSLRRDFTYVTVATAARAEQIYERAGSSLPLPRPHRHCCQIIDGKPLVNRNAFGFLPYFIRRLIDVCGILGEIQTHVYCSLP